MWGRRTRAVVSLLHNLDMVSLLCSARSSQKEHGVVCAVEACSSATPEHCMHDNTGAHRELSLRTCTSPLYGTAQVYAPMPATHLLICGTAAERGTFRTFLCWQHGPMRGGDGSHE